MARILVNLNVREGLVKDLMLSWGPLHIKQLLDYENIPFQCRRFHAYGHPVSNCHLPVRTLNGHGRRQNFDTAATEMTEGFVAPTSS